MPFFTGRAIHEALEAYYSEGADLIEFADQWILNEVQQMGTLWAQEIQKVNEEIHLINGMLRHYQLWVEKHTGRFADSNLQFLAMETDFRVPLRNLNGNKSNRVFFAGRFDGVVMTMDDGQFWLWETKTARSIKSLVDTLSLDEQCGAYIFAAEQIFDVTIAGVLYNIMRKKIPTEPDVLQNGLLSKRASMDTTADAYLDAVRRNHPDFTKEDILEHYGDFLQSLLAKGNTFFARIPIYRTQSEVDNLAINLWYTALEMVRPSTPIYPAPSWAACNFCRFRAPCVVMNAGGDVESVLASEYRQREQPKFVAEADDDE